MAHSKLIKSLTDPFLPPFKGLAALLWVYYVYCFLVMPDSTILRGDLPDTDDYTYLNQVIDWLQGQSWFDNVQYRMAPPEGVPIHYTRLVQLPMALLISVFHALGLPMRGAALVTAVIYPPILLALYFRVASWAAETFLPPDWTRVTAYTALFSGAMIYQFSLGHVDHHGIEGIVTLAAFGCLARLLMRPERLQWAVLCGFLLALSLYIALEALPWVIVMASVLTLWGLVRGASASRAAGVFGLALYLSGVFFLILYKRPEHWFDIDALAYSVVYVILLGCIAIVNVAVAMVSTRFAAGMRWGVGLGLGIGLAIVYFLHFPELIYGPYGAMDPTLAQVMLKQIVEARPIVDHVGSPLAALIFCFGVILSLIICIGQLQRAKGAMRWAWGALTVLVAVALLLSAFYQVRMLRPAMLFSVIPLAVFLREAWLKIGQTMKGRPRFWAELGLLVLVGPLGPVFLVSLTDGRAFSTGVLLFAAHNTPQTCEMSVLEQVLRMSDLYGERSLTIMNMIDQGPELLFRTPHKVMAAPYHTNVRGTMESVHFFKTNDVEEARQIVERDKIDLVVMCRMISSIYLRDNHVGMVKIGDHGKVTLPKDASFAEQLIYHKVPDWLHEVQYPMLSDYLVFEVKSSFPDRKEKAKAGADLQPTLPTPE